MDADPDSRARTHLANERTFLAWFRTGVTLVALGLAAAQFLAVDDRDGPPLVQLVSTLVIISGSAAVVTGLVRYRVGRRQIDALGYLPAWTSITAAATGGIVLAVVAAVLVWVLRPL